MAGAESDQRGRVGPRSPGFSQPRSYVEVDSIDEALARVEELGGTVTHGKAQITETSWWAAIEDPDGNVMGLYEGTTATE